MIKDKLHTISDENAKEVALILLKSHLPYNYEFDKITRQEYVEQHGVDSEECVYVYFNAKVTNDMYKNHGWEDEKVFVKLIESDRYHNYPYFIGCRKTDKQKNWNSLFLSNQIEAIEYLKEKELL